MPTVMPAAWTGPPRPERMNGLAAAPPRKVRRESGCLVMNTLLDGRALASAAWMMELTSVNGPRSFRCPCLSSRQLRDLCAAEILRRGVARQHRAEIELRVAVLIQQRAMLDGTKVMVHHRYGGLGIASAQGGDDFAMLVDGAIGGMRPAV